MRGGNVAKHRELHSQRGPINRPAPPTPYPGPTARASENGFGGFDAENGDGAEISSKVDASLSKFPRSLSKFPDSFSKFGDSFSQFPGSFSQFLRSFSKFPGSLSQFLRSLS